MPEGVGLVATTLEVFPSLAGQLLDVLLGVAGFPHGDDRLQNEPEGFVLRRHILAPYPGVSPRLSGRSNATQGPGVRNPASPLLLFIRTQI